MNKWLIILAALLWSVPSTAQGADLDAAWNAFHRAQTALLEVLQNQYPEQVNTTHLLQMTAVLNAADRDVLLRAGLDAPTLQQLSRRIDQLTAELQQFGKAEIHNPDVSIGACGVWTDDALYALSVINDILGGVLAAIQWACEETVGGFNSVNACVYPEMAVQAFAGATETGDFCIKDIAHGVSVAIYDTNKSIAEQMNDLFDEPLGSRARAADMNALILELEDIQAQLDFYFPRYLPAIQQRQAAAEAELTAQNTQLLDAQTRQHTLQQQQIVLNARLQDINQRLADTRQGAVDARNRNQALLQRVGQIRDSLNAINQLNDEASDELHRMHTVLTLLQTDGGAVLKLQLPAHLGGELEQVRELVLQHLLMAQTAGFNTAAAQSLINQGDGAFNQGKYRQAYQLYAEGYRAITTGQRRQP